MVFFFQSKLSKILTPKLTFSSLLSLLVIILLTYLYWTKNLDFWTTHILSRSSLFLKAVFSDGLLQRGLVSALFVGITASIIGVLVLLRGLIFLGETISHAAFAGAALAVLLSLEPTGVIMLLAVLSSLGIGYINEKELMRDEVIIGITFTFFMALAIVFIGLLPFYSSEVNSILFGNLLFVTTENLLALIVVTGIVLISTFVFRKELYFMSFDANMASLSGIPVRWLNYFFLILVALTISVSLKAIGAILVFAMLITPAAAAHQWSFRIRNVTLLSMVFGIFSTFFGLYLAFLLDLPTGSTIILTLTLLFFISFLLSPKRQKARNILECRFCSMSYDKDEECQNCLAEDIRHTHEGEETRILKENIPEDIPTTPHSHE